MTAERRQLQARCPRLEGLLNAAHGTSGARARGAPGRWSAASRAFLASVGARLPWNYRTQRMNERKVMGRAPAP